MEKYLQEFLDKNKVLFDDYKQRLWKDVRQPLSVTIELTPHCNFNCIHCYMKNCHTEKEMSYERILKIIDILYEKGIVFLTLTGGEVFTRNDFRNIYLYAKKKGFIVGIFTNAYNITDSDIELLNEYPPLLVDVSLYGATDTTYEAVTGVQGSFERVINNCKKMISSGIRVALKSPIINKTYSELGKMRKIAYELGVDFRFSFDISPTIENDKSTEIFEVSVKDMFKAEIRDSARIREGRKNAAIDNPYCNTGDNVDIPLFLCQIATNEFFIDYKGYMCPCASFRSAGIEMNDDNFDEIWISFSKYKKMNASNSYKCAKCDSRLFCKVCPAEMESYYGNLEAVPNSMCNFAKMRKAYFKDELSAEDVIKKI